MNKYKNINIFRKVERKTWEGHYLEVVLRMHANILYTLKYFDTFIYFILHYAVGKIIDYNIKFDF